ncbi:MAG TPA: Gfo/Idh/MocA family oxidoreductase [Candidatus Methylacidiphilales bacterium]|nr:Gfo/Idh/MocA family oxidoreductase [Candidatus Methylacidiphilales bacterium]
MQTQQVRFGFIGAGAISHHSAGEVNRHANGRVVAAQDLHPARLEELCSAYKIPKGYATADELLADPNVDAVYIAVPNKFHVPLAIQALRAGKHVILEKPFALNYAEAKLASEVAAEMGKVLTLGMNQRFERSPQAIKALVERGDLGEIYHIKAYWFRRSGIPKLGTWFGNKQLAGAGALYDIGVHFLDLALYLLGDFEPMSVSGATYTKFGHLGLGAGSWGRSDNEGLAFDVDDFATGMIRFPGGVSISLDITWACHAEEQNRADVQLYGTKGGAIAKGGRFFRPNSETGEYTITQDPAVPIRYPHCSRFHNFINHLLTGEELCVPITQALAVQRILDGLGESAATGREVRFDGPVDAPSASVSPTEQVAATPELVNA